MSTAPFAPVSEAPNASITIAFGSFSLISALMDGERIAPPDTIASTVGTCSRCADRVDQRTGHGVADEADHEHVLAFDEVPDLVARRTGGRC